MNIFMQVAQTVAQAAQWMTDAARSTIEIVQGVSASVQDAAEMAQDLAQGAAEVAQGAGQAAEAAQVAAETMSFWTLFTSGGWLMWVLLLLGALAVFLFVERFVAIRRASQVKLNFMNRIRDKISDGNIASALESCKRTDSPIARMVEKGIERIGRPMPEIQNAIENQANLEVSRLSVGLPYLAMISGGAPMLGFLGTVVGLVSAFMAMEGMGGTVDISVLAGGMYVAMLTTVGGLVVGIPAYFGYNYLVARIDRLIFQMEANSIAFMDILNQPVGK
jgi:biopolymer transport protein ExbB